MGGVCCVPTMQVYKPITGARRQCDLRDVKRRGSTRKGGGVGDVWILTAAVHLRLLSSRMDHEFKQVV